jgi:uncharacterized protein YutE (UPF0331/DUF86 family)
MNLDIKRLNQYLLFFDFRNTLIHRYWDVKDELLIENLKNNYKNFYEFIDIIRESFIKINEKNV